MTRKSKAWLIVVWSALANMWIALLIWTDYWLAGAVVLQLPVLALEFYVINRIVRGKYG